jgi:hypothetical protein
LPLQSFAPSSGGLATLIAVVIWFPIIVVNLGGLVSQRPLEAGLAVQLCVDRMEFAPAFVAHAHPVSCEIEMLWNFGEKYFALRTLLDLHHDLARHSLVESSDPAFALCPDRWPPVVGLHADREI